MVQNISKEHQELLIQKHRHHIPENCNFSKHNKSGNVSQPGVKHILMFTLNNNLCRLRAYRKLNYTKPCRARIALLV